MPPQIDNCTRAQIVTLKSLGWPARKVREHLGLDSLTLCTIQRIYKRACERGFSERVPVVLDKHCCNGPRPGRPTKQTAAKIKEVEAAVTTDRYGREKTLQTISEEVGISPTTIRRILKKQGYRKTKPTRKPGLTEAMKKRRLDWCLKHQDLDDDFWHKLIWTDETSVLLGQRRGGYKIWRKPHERVVKSCIRPRWKGYSEFMFWCKYTTYFGSIFTNML
jgi:transposase